MEADTLKRFDRLVAILIQLQSKKIIKSQELADRFGVSLRTIYRDVQTLEKAGVPLYGEAGIGYSIVEGYKLPPVMFTQKEAGSFLAAEKLMQQFTDKGLGEHFESAMYKIKSVLRGSEKEWLTALDAQITVNKTKPVFNQSVPNALELLFESLAEKKQIVLNYQPLYAESPEYRTIEPVGLFYENNFWYILAYCHLRQDYRQFRLDRIYGIKKTEDAYVLKHGTVEEYRKKEQKIKHTTEVELLVNNEIVRYLALGHQYYQVLSTTKNDKHTTIKLQVDLKDHGFIRWLLMFADCLQIIQPNSLKKEFGDIIAQAFNRLTN